MSDIKFACIVYIDEKGKKCKKSEIKSTSDIFVKEKDGKRSYYLQFDPQHQTDFCRTKWYFIKWRNCSGDCDDDHDHNIFVRICILLLGTTEAEVLKKMKAKRLQYPKKMESEETSTSHAETDVVEDKSKNSKEAKKIIAKKRKAAAHDRNTKILQDVQSMFALPQFVDVNNDDLSTNSDVMAELSTSNYKSKTSYNALSTDARGNIASSSQCSTTSSANCKQARMSDESEVIDRPPLSAKKSKDQGDIGLRTSAVTVLQKKSVDTFTKKMCCTINSLPNNTSDHDSNDETDETSSYLSSRNRLPLQDLLHSSEANSLQHEGRTNNIDVSSSISELNDISNADDDTINNNKEVQPRKNKNIARTNISRSLRESPPSSIAMTALQRNRERNSEVQNHVVEAVQIHNFNDDFERDDGIDENSGSEENRHVEVNRNVEENRDIEENHDPEGAVVENVDDYENNANQADEGNLKSVRDFVVHCVKYYKAKEGHGYTEAQKRYSTVNDDFTYLGENIVIDTFRWLMILEDYKHKPNVFLRTLLTIIWTPVDLANRALILTNNIDNIPNRSPVKLIEHVKLRLTISLYYDYLLRHCQHISVAERANYLLQSTHIISLKIRDLRLKQKSNRERRQLNKIRKRLRYNHTSQMQ